jgi:hypothetical protein
LPSSVLVFFKKRFEELGRKLGRTSKEYWIKLRRTLKEPSNFGKNLDCVVLDIAQIRIA